MKGYVKPKKLWTKRFSEKEISDIWNSFIEASPLSKKEWEGKSLTKVIKKQGQFIHPETDKYDDTEGVQPSHVKTILEKFSVEDMTKLFKFFYNSLIFNSFLSLFERYGILFFNC